MGVKGVHPSDYQISYDTIYLDSDKSRFRACNPWKSAFFVYLAGESASPSKFCAFCYRSNHGFLPHGNTSVHLNSV